MARKLRSVSISDHFQAILGCVLEEDWTTPRLIEMVITPDGDLLGRCDGETTFKAFMGESADLIKNIHGVAPVAELDGDEVGYRPQTVNGQITFAMQDGVFKKLCRDADATSERSFYLILDEIIQADRPPGKAITSEFLHSVLATAPNGGARLLKLVALGWGLRGFSFFVHNFCAFCGEVVRMKMVMRRLGSCGRWASLGGRWPKCG